MNPYEILGVSADASDEELARAYKQLAKQYHPDLNPGDAVAAEKMGQINRAYDDIRSMRQQGQAYSDASHYRPGYGPYQDPFGPFYTQRTYYYTYRPRRRSPVGVIIAVIVMFYIMRLILAVMFSGYSSYYYFAPNGFSGTGPRGYYGYYQTVPRE